MLKSSLVALALVLPSLPVNAQLPAKLPPPASDQAPVTKAPPESPATAPQPERTEPPPPAAAPRLMSAEQIARTLMPGVVMIVCDNGTEPSLGSGFFVRPGIIATNLHVVRYMLRGGVVLTTDEITEEPRWWVSEVLAVDDVHDIALLAVSTGGNVRPPVLSMMRNEKSLAIGQKIYALGNPQGLSGTMSEGIISSQLRTDGDSSLIQITAPISPGSSGGPIISERGEVVGVAVASLRGGQNLNFAIPASRVLDLMAKLDSSRREPATAVGNVEHAWKVSPSVAKALGTDASEVGFANPPSSAPADAGDSFSMDGGTPTMSDTEPVYAALDLEYLSSIDRSFVGNQGSIYGVRINSVGGMAAVGGFPFVLTVYEPSTGRSSPESSRFIFFASNPRFASQIRNAVEKYRTHDVRIDFAVVVSGSDSMGGVVLRVMWTDKSGKLLEMLEADGL